jgi:hypothetical protein
MLYLLRMPGRFLHDTAAIGIKYYVLLHPFLNWSEPIKDQPINYVLMLEEFLPFALPCLFVLWDQRRHMAPLSPPTIFGQTILGRQGSPPARYR